MTNPTIDQIRSAQESGNKAWARAYGLGKDPAQCSDAYREAIDAAYAEQERSRVESLRQRNAEEPVPDGWFVNPAVTLASEETQRLIETTRTIWRETQPIEY